MSKIRALTEADLDALHRELAGIIPETVREDLPNMLRRAIELKQMKLDVGSAEILVEIAGGIVSRIVPRLT